MSEEEKSDLYKFIFRNNDRLYNISKVLSDKIYPLSNLQENRYQLQLDHAIKAINLARSFHIE